MSKIKVGVAGFGVIGQRLADGVARQEDARADYYRKSTFRGRFAFVDAYYGYLIKPPVLRHETDIRTAHGNAVNHN